jgi:LPXTG-motif cell wall-anchored protein
MWRGTLTRIATLPSPGVPAPHRIAAAAVTLALALTPATALAQNGAGDEQYTDPFANGSQQPAKPKPKPQPQQTTTQQQTTAQQQSTTPQTTAQPQTTTQQAAPSTQSSSGPKELPRTGFDLIPLALLGVALVAAGLLLRRRPRDGRR